MTTLQSPKRHILRHLAGAALLCALATTAAAQAWPTKAVSLVVPFPAGGTTDVLARALGQELAKSLGQPVIVENKPGAGATLGADFVAKAKPDGYTLLMGAVHHTIATSVYRKLAYDFQKDLAPVTTVAMVPNVLVVSFSEGDCTHFQKCTALWQIGEACSTSWVRGLSSQCRESRITAFINCGVPKWALVRVTVVSRF